MAEPELRELTELADLHELSDLFTVVWGAAEPLVTGDLLRAMSKAGSYIAGAYVDGRLAGGALGFHAAPAERVLHSHIAAVLPQLAGQRIGLALKQHQRTWALERGINAIEWTYDPLIARNAHFNIVKLGARPVEYLPDFYGPMEDAINGLDESDRILVRWELDAPAGAAGLAGSAGSASEEICVEVPGDIEALRVSDPAAAARWRLHVRDGLAPRMADGWRVTGFDRDSGYLLAPPASVRRTQPPARPRC
jgi:predicted GNAT superfamily acetyltransferase